MLGFWKMPDEMYVVRLENDCLKDIMRTLLRCRLLNKMKGMKPTREPYLRRARRQGLGKALRDQPQRRTTLPLPEAPRDNIYTYAF